MCIRSIHWIAEGGYHMKWRDCIGKMLRFFGFSLFLFVILMTSIGGCGGGNGGGSWFVREEPSYSTSDLAGTWYVRSIRTQQNDQPDNFGYGTGALTFRTDGQYSGTLTDQDGTSWSESGSASVTPDGEVTLWAGSDAVLSADKGVILSNYSDGDEYDLDVVVKKGV